MAPENSQSKRKARENQYPFQLGVKGRKTGLTLPKLGERDEHGLEPMDHLFSSPENPKNRNQTNLRLDITLSEEEDMEFGESTTHGPVEELAKRKKLNSLLSVPKSRSPIKTFLDSPARRNPAVAPVSSPERGSIVDPQNMSKPASVQRKLEFSRSKSDARRYKVPIKNSSKKNSPNQSLSSKIMNGHQSTETFSPENQSEEDDNDFLYAVNKNSQREEREENVGTYMSENESENDNRSTAQLKSTSRSQPKKGNSRQNKSEHSIPSKSRKLQNKLDDKRPQGILETEEEQGLKNSINSQNSAKGMAPIKNKPGRPKKIISPDADDGKSIAPLKNKPGRQKKNKLPEGSDLENGKDAGHIKNKSDMPNIPNLAEESDSDDGRSTVPLKNKPDKQKKTTLPEVSDTDDTRPYKRSRHALVDGSANNIEEGKRKNANKSKNSTKAKTSTVETVESTRSQLAPPLPKTKGLLILRHETVEDNKDIRQTRSGRNSIKPLAFWSNEKVEFEEGELTTQDLTRGFTGRKIKHVIRAQEILPPAKRNRSKTHSLKSKKRKQLLESESDGSDEFESWEIDPGRIVADVRNWDPEDQSGSNTNEKEEEIALSSSAIITRDIANASFRFAKTLTLPFFGAGMVDLPPGSEKKQKNSRKMQMAFFVFYGKVQVTVNDNVFRISKGGMWQVPRGNFYGIQNDYDKPARIFFSQGCEIEEDVEES